MHFYHHKGTNYECQQLVNLDSAGYSIINKIQSVGRVLDSPDSQQ